MRGCFRMLPLMFVLFGMLGCAWGFYLGRTAAGETVSQAMGISFYVGWFCGAPLAVVGAMLLFLQSILGAAGGLLGRFGGLDNLSDALPFGGDGRGLGILDDVLNRRD